MRILFVNPIVRYHDEPRHAPLGILQLLAVLERDHPKVKFQLYDANAHRVDDYAHGGMRGLESALRSDDYDVVAIGGLITAYNYIKQAVKTCKRIQPDAKIVAGGGFFTSMPTEMMRLLPEIYCGIVGEAYSTLPELLKMVEAREEPSHVNGVAYRSNGEASFTEPRKLIPDLDWLPFPAYKYAPLEIYFKHSGILMSDEAMRSKKRLDACMSLGCPFLCKFCWDLGITSNVVQTGRPGGKTLFRHHSAGYIGRYIEHLRSSFVDIEPEGIPVDFIAWFDENIVAHDAQTGFTWLKSVEEELWRRGLVADCIKKGVPHNSEECTGPHFGGTSHAGLIRKETLKTLKRIGFVYLDYGLESFSLDILKGLGKGATPETNKRAVRWTQEAGIAPIPNQIIMFPDETWRTIGEMLDAWEETGIVSKPFVCTAYPGSEWFVKYRGFILEQYGGSLDSFLEDLEDATKVSALLTDRFTPAEAVGIQNILAEAAKMGDYKGARRLLALSVKKPVHAASSKDF